MLDKATRGLKPSTVHRSLSNALPSSLLNTLSSFPYIDPSRSYLSSKATTGFAIPSISLLATFSSRLIESLSCWKNSLLSLISNLMFTFVSYQHRIGILYRIYEAVQYKSNNSEVGFFFSFFQATNVRETRCHSAHDYYFYKDNICCCCEWNIVVHSFVPIIAIKYGEAVMGARENIDLANVCHASSGVV